MVVCADSYDVELLFEDINVCWAENGDVFAPYVVLEGECVAYREDAEFTLVSYLCGEYWFTFDSPNEGVDKGSSWAPIPCLCRVAWRHIAALES